MPPPNPRRRQQLADAAIEVLAVGGARGLTHRAVDAEADVPPGTTSRYFRTREALVSAVVDRAAEQQYAEMEAAADRLGPLGPGQLAGELTGLVRAALVGHPSRQLAMLELFLESTRRPELRARLDEATAGMRRVIGRVLRAAEVPVTDQEERLMLVFFTGLIFTLLTRSPEAAGAPTDDDVEEMVTAAVDGMLRRHAVRR
jgi:DNA-binding transcriptional regulator YbjK